MTSVTNPVGAPTSLFPEFMGSFTKPTDYISPKTVIDGGMDSFQQTETIEGIKKTIKDLLGNNLFGNKKISDDDLKNGAKKLVQQLKDLGLDEIEKYNKIIENLENTDVKVVKGALEELKGNKLFWKAGNLQDILGGILKEESEELDDFFKALNLSENITAEDIEKIRNGIKTPPTQNQLFGGSKTISAPNPKVLEKGLKTLEEMVKFRGSNSSDLKKLLQLGEFLDDADSLKAFNNLKQELIEHLQNNGINGEVLDILSDPNPKIALNALDIIENNKSSFLNKFVIGGSKAAQKLAGFRPAQAVFGIVKNNVHPLLWLLGGDQATAVKAWNNSAVVGKSISSAWENGSSSKQFLKTLFDGAKSSSKIGAEAVYKAPIKIFQSALKLGPKQLLKKFFTGTAVGGSILGVLSFIPGGNFLIDMALGTPGAAEALKNGNMGQKAGMVAKIGASIGLTTALQAMFSQPLTMVIAGLASRLPFIPAAVASGPVGWAALAASIVLSIGASTITDRAFNGLTAQANNTNAQQQTAMAPPQTMNSSSAGTAPFDASNLPQEGQAIMKELKDAGVSF